MTCEMLIKLFATCIYLLLNYSPSRFRDGDFLFMPSRFRNILYLFANGVLKNNVEKLDMRVVGTLRIMAYIFFARSSK